MRTLHRTLRTAIAGCASVLAGMLTAAPLDDMDHNVGFVRNEGQIQDQNGQPAKDVLYVADVDGIRVQLRRSGFSYQVMCSPEVTDHGTLEMGKSEKASAVSVERIDFDLPRALSDPSFVEETEELPGMYNYIGQAEINGVKSFRTVKYVNAWEGADLVFEIVRNAEGREQFKYSVIAREGTSLASLSLAMAGLSDSDVKGGKMRLDGLHFGIEERIPESWLVDREGGRSPVEMAFAENEGRTAEMRFTCADRSLTTVPAGQQLVIDPTPNRTWGRYFGGVGLFDEYARIAVKNTGTSRIALTGSTLSPGLATAGVYQVNLSNTNGGMNFDGFVATFSSTGALVWATYYGGDQDDRTYNVAFDPSGDVYACGTTRTQINYIIATSTSHQPMFGGGVADGYLVRFGGTNGQRKWGTYYGGSGDDRVMSVVVDATGNVYIGGDTDTPTGGNVISSGSGSWQPGYNGGWDAFVAKFNSSGVRQWGTYYGGTGYESCGAVTTDFADNIYLVGVSNSVNTGNVLATPGSWQSTNIAGDYDGIVAKFTSAGSRIWATYYGGAGIDMFRDASVACSDELWVCGGTNSQNTGNLVATPGAHQTNLNNPMNDDGFLVKFNELGVRLYGSYYGGNQIDVLHSVCVIGDLVYVAGDTQSPSPNQEIATLNSWQPHPGGNSDGYFALFTPSGARSWGSYYGGTGFDYCMGVEYFAGGKIVIGGTTNTSTGTAIATGGTYGGGANDWYLAQFTGTVYTDCIPAMPTAPPSPMMDLCEQVKTGVLHDASNGSLVLQPELFTGSTLNVYDLTGRRVFTTLVRADRILLPDAVRTSPFVVQLVTSDGACSKKIVP